MRILAVDDDRVMSRLLSGLLESWGHDVVTASDGIQAIAMVERDPAIRLVLLDWVLPGMDGPDVCRRLREMPCDVPAHIILLTSRRDPEDIVAGLDAGADDYVVKPFHFKELRARVGAGVRIITLQQRLANKIRQLETASGQLRALSGLLPICAYCKSIRDDANYWHRVEEYVASHADVKFTHGICPRCIPQVTSEAAEANA